MDTSHLSISELSECIKMRQVSPVKVVQDCLVRIEKLNSQLNAFITVTADQALHEAKIAEDEIKDGKWRSPLHGIPVAVKDFFDTAGIRTTAGFRGFKDRVPQKDAVVVQKLKEAGAIIVGKTNMHELGMGTTSLESFYGPVHNPWNTKFIAGGSSGGSAAAVAARLCYATVDTDAVGSCRIPTSCCGVTGFKATYGLISGRGILDGERADPAILKFAHVGTITRTAQDAALVLNVIADQKTSESPFNHDSSSAFKPGKRFALGIVKNIDANGAILEWFRECVREFKIRGNKISEVEVPFAAATFDIKNVDDERRNISQKLFKDIDLILLPTTKDLTPTIDDARLTGPQAVSPAYTFFANYFGLPAITVPCGYDSNDLPLGLQIVGAPWNEGAVLSAGGVFQNATTWHLRSPGFQSY